MRLSLLTQMCASVPPRPVALRRPPPRPPTAPRRQLVLLRCPADEDPRGPPPQPRTAVRATPLRLAS